MSIGERIIECRRKAGMSQEQLADRLNVSRQAVSRWELCQSNPDTDNIIKMCEIFDVNSDYLLLGKQEKKEDRYDFKETKMENSYQSMKKSQIFRSLNDKSKWSLAGSIYLAWHAFGAFMFSAFAYFATSMFNNFGKNISNGITGGFPSELFEGGWGTPQINFTNPFSGLFYGVAFVVFIIGCVLAYAAIRMYFYSKNHRDEQLY